MTDEKYCVRKYDLVLCEYYVNEEAEVCQNNVPTRVFIDYMPASSTEGTL